MIINCFFCKKKLKIQKISGTCYCKDCKTTYVNNPKGTISHGFFDSKLTHKPSNKSYNIWLNFITNETKVTVVVDLDWEEIDVLVLPGFPLTPSNVATRLPILLTFS